MLRQKRRRKKLKRSTLNGSLETLERREMMTATPHEVSASTPEEMALAEYTQSLTCPGHTEIIGQTGEGVTVDDQYTENVDTIFGGNTDTTTPEADAIVADSDQGPLPDDETAPVTPFVDSNKNDTPEAATDEATTNPPTPDQHKDLIPGNSDNLENEEVGGIDGDFSTIPPNEDLEKVLQDGEAGDLAGLLVNVDATQVEDTIKEWSDEAQAGLLDRLPAHIAGPVLAAMPAQRIVRVAGHLDAERMELLVNESETTQRILDQKLANYQDELANHLKTKSDSLKSNRDKQVRKQAKIRNRTKDSMSGIKDRIKSLNRSMNRANDDIDDLVDEIRDFKSRLSGANSNLRSKLRKLRGLSRWVSKGPLKRAVRGLENRVRDLERDIDRAESRIDDIEENISRKARKVRNLNSKYKAHKKALNKATSNIRKIKKKANARIQSVRNNVAAKREIIDNLVDVSRFDRAQSELVPISATSDWKADISFPNAGEKMTFDVSGMSLHSGTGIITMTIRGTVPVKVDAHAKIRNVGSGHVVANGDLEFTAQAELDLDDLHGADAAHLTVTTLEADAENLRLNNDLMDLFRDRLSAMINNMIDDNLSDGQSELNKVLEGIDLMEHGGPAIEFLGQLRQLQTGAGVSELGAEVERLFDAIGLPSTGPLANSIIASILQSQQPTEIDLSLVGGIIEAVADPIVRDEISGLTLHETGTTRLLDERIVV